MSDLLFSASYDTASQELMAASPKWVGRPKLDREQVFALFHSVSGDPKNTRWYVYGISHDAIAVSYENLPEVVRMAYLLMQ